MYTLLKNKNEGLQGEMIAFTQKLVRAPSPSLAEGDVARLVAEEMRRAGYDQVIQDDSGNVVGIIRGRESDPTVLLNSHMDTIPLVRESLWSTPPFDGRVENGWLHGLGAADCKGGLAAQLYAGALLKRSLLPLRGNLVMAATVAEENGCSVGVHALIERTLPDLGLRPNYALLGEPTELGLYYGHDGWVEMDIQIEGPNPFQVDDAAQAIFAEYSGRAAGAPDQLSLRQPSFHMTGHERRATIQLSRRLLPAENMGTILTQTRHEAVLAAKTSGAVAVDVAVRQENQRMYTGSTSAVRRLVHAWSTDPFDPLMERARQALAAAECSVRPGRWTLRHIGMGTAGSVLTRDFQIPTIGYGPGRESLAHSHSEAVELTKLAECVYGTAAIVHSLIGVPVFGWTSEEI